MTADGYSAVNISKNIELYTLNSYLMIYELYINTLV